MVSRLLVVWAWASLHVVLSKDYTGSASLPDTNESLENTSSGPIWVYKCEPELGCQRSERPLPTVLAGDIYDSLDMCRTVCGKFGGVWPRPMSASIGAQILNFHPDYMRFDLVDAPAATHELLIEMSKILKQNLWSECSGNVTQVAQTPVVVYLNVKSKDLTLGWSTDESYTVDVQSRASDIAVHIAAETVFGARHGMETLSHLVSSNTQDYRDNTLCGLYIVTGAKIRDRPVYPHRGLMLDTSRNFIPMQDIKRMIDGMAASKMNVFHWHATDSHSFPLEFGRVPQLSKYGAYSAAEVFSTQEIAALLQYARARGVRVILEIDSPAHAGNGWQWGQEYGMGDLAVCVNAQPWRGLCIQPPCGQLNPANPSMYRILRELYRDIAETWPRGELFHMGGDEVFIKCWNSSSEIVTYMEEKGYDQSQEGFIRLWAEFHATALRIWDEESAAAGTRGASPVMLWSSELTQAHRIQGILDKDRYVIEVWEPEASPLLAQLVALGYRVVAAPKDRWYLDHGFWGVTRYGNWRRMYEHRLPRDAPVLGGEVAMWSEYVDQNALDGRVWPRAAAVAERLWADPLSAASAAEPRLQRQRSRLRARGLRPDVLTPAWCALHDQRCL